MILFLPAFGKRFQVLISISQTFHSLKSAKKKDLRRNVFLLFIKFPRKVAHVTAENAFAQALHQIVQIGNIVQRKEHRARHFAHVYHVAEIRLRVVAAAIATAIGVKWSKILDRKSVV